LNIVRDITDRKHAEQQLQEAYRAVEALAVTDPLTGLANRRQFDQRLTAEWRRSLRDRKPLSMLLLDVDLFKAYNDTYGHVRGDSCLKQIAEAAQDVVTRPGDVVARFGGEEFTIILPNTDNDGASLVADAVCEAVRTRNLLHSASPYERVTISVGCATILPSLGRSSIDLVELADKALYQAKRNGRNQVCTARGERLTGPPSKPADIAEITISKTA
jgi:diguanylate cyclase (GGDEF)-like protein